MAFVYVFSAWVSLEMGWDIVIVVDFAYGQK